MTQQRENDLFEKLEDWGAEPDLTLEETFMNDRKLFLECLFRLRDDGSLPLLRDALARRDSEVAVRAVHTLKGVANNLGLMPLADAAVAVLADLRAGAFDRGAAGLPEIEARWGELAAILEPYRAEEARN